MNFRFSVMSLHFTNNGAGTWQWFMLPDLNTAMAPNTFLLNFHLKIHDFD